MGEIEKRNGREEKRSTHRELGGSEAAGCAAAAFGLRSPTLRVCNCEEEKSRRPRVESRHLGFLLGARLENESEGGESRREYVMRRRLAGMMAGGGGVAGAGEGRRGLGVLKVVTVMMCEVVTRLLESGGLYKFVRVDDALELVDGGFEIDIKSLGVKDCRGRTRAFAALDQLHLLSLVKTLGIKTCELREWDIGCTSCWC
ncbi:hypothetical protein Droror1_Dr00005492 [Drosera rotundifolia]